VPKRLFRPPDHLVEQWPEVFEDMYMNTMPLMYLNYIRIVFDDGRIWEIDVKAQLTDAEPNMVADKILDIFDEYSTEIKDINFDVDTNQLKKDIIDKTKGMLG
jgi:hypothetical protein